MSRIRSFIPAALATFALNAIAADEIVIGASLPLSGPLAGFGNYQKWGYETAVNDVNKAGGISIGGKKMPVMGHEQHRSLIT